MMRLRVLDPLRDHREAWSQCQRCPLGAKAYRHVLYECPTGEADVVLVGEGPGEAEDAIGRPFVGPAGKKVLRPALSHVSAQFPKVRWALTNLVSCRPQTEGRNRVPEVTEVYACQPRLHELLKVWQPRVVVALGAVPLEYLPSAIPLLHPAALLHMGWTPELQAKWTLKLWEIFLNVHEDLYGPYLEHLPEDAWRRTAEFKPRIRRVLV